MFLTTLGALLTVKSMVTPLRDSAEGGGIKPSTGITDSAKGPNPEKLAILTRLELGNMVAWVVLPHAVCSSRCSVSGGWGWKQAKERTLGPPASLVTALASNEYKHPKHGGPHGRDSVCVVGV